MAKETLNYAIGNLFKTAGNMLAAVVPPDSALYRNMALLGMRLSAKARLKRRTSLYINVSLVDHCNLKCVGCDAFACIAEEHFLDIDTFTRDMTRLSELTGGNIEILNLVGGEPLLNPHITEFMKAGRQCFPLDRIGGGGGQNALNEINIVTNGILLPQMGEEFWNTCREQSVVVSITKYPIHIDIETIEKAAKAHGVTLRYWNGDAVKTMWRLPFDLEGRQDAKKSFELCFSANRCTTLLDGKLFSCVSCAHIGLFNKRFGTHLMHTEGDYVDIYKAKDAGEIYDFLCHPVPFCRYCKTGDMSFGIKWRVSKGEIEEWT